jgi:hypothetical protein
MSLDLAQIPTKVPEFAFWLLNLRQDAETDANLSSVSRAAIVEQFDILNRTIVTLQNLGADGLLQTEAHRALQAFGQGLHAAIRIGAYHADAARTPPTRTANRKRMRKTYAGRRRDDFQEIVARLTKELCMRRPELIGQFGATAREMSDSVVAEVAALSKPLQGYATGDLIDSQARKRFIDMLRQRVKCVTWPDD